MNNQPSFRRILGAIFYDWLFCLGIMFVFIGIIVTLNKGNAITAHQKPIVSVFLFLIIFAYFFIFWRQGGQTPGMKVWSIQLLSKTAPSSSSKLAIRFFVVAASCGLSIFSRIFNPQKLSWHDRISGTFLIRTKKTR